MKSNTNLFSLDGKVAVVTGGYGHLGSVMVEGLLDQGAEVFVLGRSQEKFALRFGEQDRLNFVACDVTSEISIAAAVQTVQKKIKSLNILVNNAVSAPHWKGAASVTSLSATWEEAIKGSLISVVLVTESFLPMLKAQGGSVINIASMYGTVSPDPRIYPSTQTPSPGYYGAAKSGLIQLTRYWACNWAPSGIRVNCLSPGAFPKPEVYKDEIFISNLESKTPMARLGKPEELKGSVIFLASNASTYVTGQNLGVDGGWTAW